MTTQIASANDDGFRACLVPNMPFTTYAGLGGINWSSLKEMRRSPLHYAHRLVHSLGDNMRRALGRAVHTAVLEPDRLALDYAVFNGERRQGKAWEAFEAVHANRTILKASEYAQALAVRDAVRAHPEARALLERGRAEQSVFWTDAATGLPCKGRMDWVSSEMLVDLKTTPDIDMRRFGSVAARFGYHCQVAWYLRGLAAVGVHVPARIIAVESEAPHDVGVFTVDDDLLYAANEEIDELMQRVRVCSAQGTWPGRYAGEEPLSLPAWWYAQAEEDAGLGVVVGGM